MLDDESPMAKHILRSAVLESRILNLSKRMTLVPSEERLRLLAECRSAFAEMRSHAAAHYENYETIHVVVAELEVETERLAMLGNCMVTEDRTSGEGFCAVCNTPITNMREFQDMVYCGTCLDIVMPALGKLGKETWTWVI
jgi:hypothetical protein